MLKVRFPNGQCITYNNACYSTVNEKGYTLYANKNEENREWIASVPIDCIVEAVDPCKIENPMIGLTLDKAFDMVVDALENKETNYNLSHMKKILKDYNAATCEWK